MFGDLSVRLCSVHFCSTVLLVLLSSDYAFATNFGWDNGAGDNLWGTANNWNPNGVPIDTDSILLTGTSSSGDQTIELNTDHFIDRIEADGAGLGKYTFNGGGSLYLYGIGDVLKADEQGGSLQIDVPILLSTIGNRTSEFWVTQNGSEIVVNGDIRPWSVDTPGGITDNHILELTSNNESLDPSVIVNGVIGDSDFVPRIISLTAGFASDAENNRGVVKVTNLNTYSGQTIVNGATLDFNSIADVGGGPSALGAPTSVANGTIRLGAVDFSSNVKVPGTLRYTGSGHSTDRTIELVDGGGGEIRADGTGPLVFTAPTFVVSAGNKRLTLSGDSTHANTIHSLILDAPGSGQNLIVDKRGSGTWVLTANNSYGGPTILTEGTLSVSDNNSLGSLNASLSFNGGTLQVTGTSFASTQKNVIWNGGAFDIVDPNHSFTVNVGSGGTGDLTKIGAGNLMLTGVNDYTGSTIIDAGGLHLANGSLVTNTLDGLIGDSLGSMGAVTVDGTDLGGNPSTWTNSRFLYVGSDGDGTLDITGGGLVENTWGYIGQFNGSMSAVIVDGTDSAGNPSTWNNSSLLYVGLGGDGTLDISGGGLVEDRTGYIGRFPSSTGTVTVDGTDSAGNPSTWNNQILVVGDEGDGTLEIKGGGLVENITGYIGFRSSSTAAVAVAGVNPNSGTPSTWDNSGTLYVGGDEHQALGTGMLTVNTGGKVSVGGELKIWDTGTVDLTGGTLDTTTLDLTAPGNTFNMTGGRLEVETVQGDLAIVGGTLAPGDSPGLTTVTGAYDQQAGATLEIEIGGDTEFDVLDITGAATLAGSLDVSLLGDFAPPPGQKFTVLTASAVTDNGLTLGGSAASQFSLLVGVDSVILQAVSGLSGDYNNDGVVDAADYTTWRDNLGAPAGTLPNDPSPGAIGPEQYGTWKSNFGNTSPQPGAFDSATVPEPSLLVLLMGGAAFVLSSRRHARGLV